MEIKTWTTISRLLDDALDLPPDSRSDWLDRQRLANFQVRLGRLDAAITNSTRGLAIIEHHAEPASGTVAAFRNTAAQALLYAGRAAQALPYLRSALDTASRTFGPNRSCHWRGPCSSAVCSTCAAEPSTRAPPRWPGGSM